MTLSERRVPTDPLSGEESLSCSRPVPWGGVLGRVRASVGSRRIVPTGVALLDTDLLYQLLLRLSSRRMAAATASMEAAIGGTPSEAEISRLARNHVAAQARGWAQTWRPWELDRVPIRGVSRIYQARATGRGLVARKSHLGPAAAWVPLGRPLRPLHTLASDWILHEPCPDELHLALAAIHENFIMRGPDHLESPLRPGRWATVTGDGWYRE